MLLKNLIKNYPINFKKLKIKGLAIDSRDVKKGFIFFGIKGNNLYGEFYINN
jgi:UDP-N-acetylmuramyl tripeptide synthase